MEKKNIKKSISVFDLELTEHEKIVYLFLKEYKNTASYKEIGIKCGICKATAMRAVNGLIEKKIIIKNNRFENGGQLSNEFTLIVN